jgi:hypothetical protein
MDTMNSGEYNEMPTNPAEVFGREKVARCLDEVLDFLGLGFDVIETVSIQPMRFSDMISFEIVVYHDRLSDLARRTLKSRCRMAVPDWAREMQAPPLTGKCHTDQWEADVTYRGAFVCTMKGEVEVEPPESTLLRANELEGMTPEAAMQYVRAEAERMRQPTVSKTFTCKPAKGVKVEA